MFLFERSFGFGVYMLILLCVCVLLTKTSAACKPILKFYIICLCVMAFFYKPYITADLYRIYGIMDFFAEMDFLYFWENFALGDSIPIANLLYWGVGKTGINALLPTFSAFVCYSFIFYIISKTQELFSISKKNVAYVLFFVMTTSIYISIIGGIRMMLALSMIAFSFFRGTVEKKVNILDILLYVLSIFIHAMSLVLIAICFAVIVFDARRSFTRKIAFILIVGGIGLALAPNFSDIISNVYEKVLYYVLGDRYSDIWEYIMGGLIMMLLVILICEYWRIRKEDDCLVLRSYNAATVICMVIAAVFCFEFSIFYRFVGHLAVILSIPMMLVTLEKSNVKPSRAIRETDFKKVMIVLSAIIALISCIRGSLSSLKFFEL